jgi:hypothetical protein
MVREESPASLANSALLSILAFLIFVREFGFFLTISDQN